MIFIIDRNNMNAGWACNITIIILLLYSLCDNIQQRIRMEDYFKTIDYHFKHVVLKKLNIFESMKYS